MSWCISQKELSLREVVIYLLCKQWFAKTLSMESPVSLYYKAKVLRFGFWCAILSCSLKRCTSKDTNYSERQVCMLYVDQTGGVLVLPFRPHYCPGTCRLGSGGVRRAKKVHAPCISHATAGGLTNSSIVSWQILSLRPHAQILTLLTARSSKI